MAQKKNAARSGSGTKRTSGSGARKTTAARVNAPQKPQREAKATAANRPMNNQFWSVILFAVGVLVLLIAAIPGARAWQTIHSILRGLFGVGIFLVPVILCYTGILVGQDKNQQASGRAVFGVLLTIIASAAVQLFFGESLAAPAEAGTSWYLHFGDSLTLLWNDGIKLYGGGVLSGIIVIPLVALFDDIGARIVIVLLIVVLLMLLTNRGIIELFELLCKPFVWLWKGMVMLAERGLPDEDDDDDYEPVPTDEESAPEQYRLPMEYDETSAEEAPRFTRRSRRAAEASEDEDASLTRTEKRRSRRAEERRMEEVSFILDRIPPAHSTDYDNIDVDIPIFEEDSANAEDELNLLLDNGITPRGTAANSLSDEEDAAFSEMIEKAAQEPDQAANRLPWLEDTDESIYDDVPAAEIPYVAPPLSLLKLAEGSVNDADRSAELREKGKQLVDTLASFGVAVRITGIRRGPSVTRYEIQPAAGVKISKITALADDIGLNLGGKSVRIEAPIPGKPAVGVEVPNNNKDLVSLREILEAPEFRESQSKLTFAVGKDIDGNVIVGDIAKMPHMIIAGTTGSGKSVCTNSIIMSILFHASPDEVRLVLIDPKVVEFQPYDGVPHLLIPVVTQPQKAAGALNWAVIEMERRYGLCAQYGVRDLKGYNAIAEKTPDMKKLPQILIIIDEFADLMMSSGKEVEAAVIRIAQKARAAGIHLILATQRPTVDVITGLIKSNVPSRIGMSVKSAQDSRIILDCSGAETLLGNGDLLFYPNGAREPKRVQGCFCSDHEVEAVAGFLKSNGRSDYDESIIEAVEQNIPAAKGEKAAGDEELDKASGDDALILKAAELAVDMNQLSTTALQRRLKLGYAKAARIVDELEERGVIGPSEGAKPRKVLMTPQQLTEWKLRVAAKGGEVQQ